MTRKIDIDQARAAFARAVGGEREVFGDFFLTRLFGLEITYPQDACEVAFDVQDFMFNPQGSVHGGVLATALDISMGHLIHHHAGPGTTLEMKIQYLAPPRSGRVTCRGEALRRGGTWFLRAEARAEGGELLAYATSTWKLLKTAPKAVPPKDPAAAATTAT
ncbi:MAG: PaaI family thioesterase [Rhodospirillales bacterium]|nr:PaaI family thioesterase [Rhodospirillales bacterium]